MSELSHLFKKAFDLGDHARAAQHLRDSPAAEKLLKGLQHMLGFYGTLAKAAGMGNIANNVLYWVTQAEQTMEGKTGAEKFQFMLDKLGIPKQVFTDNEALIRYLVETAVQMQPKKLEHLVAAAEK